jgi:imidazolonepropionase-like amidohydrolase
MKHLFAALAIVLFNGTALARLKADHASTSGVTAFVGVTVIPMDAPHVLKDQVVLVSGDRITDMGASGSIRVPKDARRIDGHGLFLMPGLADMHAHFLEEKDAYFPLYFASGVTTVRLMSVTPEWISLRDDINRGKRLGPTLLMAGPLIDGNPPQWHGSDVATTPEEARKIVQRQKKEGYDFVKVFDNLTVRSYDAVVEEAHRLHIPVVGHVPRPGGLEHVWKVPLASIEHLDGFLHQLQRQGSPFEHLTVVPANLGHHIWPPPKFFNNVDEARIPEVAAATAKSGAWVVPTLVMPLNVLPPNEVAAAFQRPTVRYATPYLRGWWRMGVEGVSTEEDWAAIRRGKELRLKIVRALHDAGVPLLIGTDTPHAFVVPGFAVHDEIQFFVNAGLTPYEAISAATVNVGKFLSKPKTIGIVAPGAQADLILLKDNPLDDVKNLARTAGVMYHGRWLSQEDLQRGLDESVAKYKQKDKTATPAEHSEQ